MFPRAVIENHCTGTKRLRVERENRATLKTKEPVLLPSKTMFHIRNFMQLVVLIILFYRNIICHN